MFGSLPQLVADLLLRGEQRKFSDLGMVFCHGREIESCAWFLGVPSVEGTVSVEGDNARTGKGCLRVVLCSMKHGAPIHCAQCPQCRAGSAMERES